MSGKQSDVAKQGRHDRLLHENEHDPYVRGKKLVEPTLCPECGVVFSGGRWQWLENAPDAGNEELCPACHRIHDKVPAGYLTLSGEFFTAHRDEIMRILHNKVEQEKAQRPLKRLMDIVDHDDESVVITFTDLHLPRGVGEAIERAYEGELEIQYTKESNIVRVYWKR